MQKLLAIVLFLITTVSASHSQRLIDIINQAEKAVVSVSSLSAQGLVVKEGSGCIISSDGLAIISAHCIYDGDSIIVETRNNKKYGISTILQLHPYSNLALIKLNTGRLRDLPFLTPARSVFQENLEVIAFGHISDLEDGMEFARIGTISNFVFLNRFAKMPIKATVKSSGAPIIASNGEMTGLVNGYSKLTTAFAIDVKVLNDTNWLTINKTPIALKKAPAIRALFNPDLNDGLLRLSLKDYELSARSLSGYLRSNPNHQSALILRSNARYMYKNTFGSKEDILLMKKLNPNSYLTFYFEALHNLNDNKKEEALSNLNQCLEKKPNFAYGLVERGRLLYLLRNNIPGAFNDYMASIAADTCYGAGYYERARLVLQHFEKQESALSDLDMAVRLDPELPGVYTIRGALKIESENYLQAIMDFDIALKKDPNDLPALFNRGLANYNLGMKDKACSDWKNAIAKGHYKSGKYYSRYCNQR